MTDDRARGNGGRLDRLARSEGFQALTLALIVLSALCLGVEAMPAYAQRWETLLYGVFVATQVWFVFEIGVRLFAHWPRLGGFFADGWNRFDFTVVVLSLLPAVGTVALLARLLRVLRLVRLVSGSDLLRGFVRGRLGVGARLLAFAVLLALSVYVFALMGFHLYGGFGDGLAAWANLPRALASVGGLYLGRVGSVPSGDGAGIALLALFYLSQLALLGGLLRPRAAVAP